MEEKELVLGIDPGPSTSGVVLFHPDSWRVVETHKKMDNEEVLEYCRSRGGKISSEYIEALYAHVGKLTVNTIRFTGRIEEAAYNRGIHLDFYTSQDIKKIVCGTASAKDPAVRQALIDQVGEQGKKNKPGPTYGVVSHAWRALAAAVAVVYLKDRPDLLEKPEKKTKRKISKKTSQKKIVDRF